jgi:ABC-type cobalamin/Fe3+-siderophores transport system ATPase subunit
MSLGQLSYRYLRAVESFFRTLNVTLKESDPVLSLRGSAVLNTLEITLPKSGSTGDEIFQISHPLLLIGSNGAGKSRMGKYIEERSPNKVHRISAQKSLELSAVIELLPLEVAEGQVFFGNVEAYKGWLTRPKEMAEHKYSYRWDHKDGISNLKKDFHPLLALLFAKKRERDENVVKALQNSTTPEAKATQAQQLQSAPHDKLIEIWNTLLPGLSIDLEKDTVVATSFGRTFSASTMSDGERVIFYLLAQVLLAKPNLILIVDEPEVHIHRSIVHKLWDALEDVRPDCGFVYMTQDLDFASSRIMSTKVWVKSYNGEFWNWEKLRPSDDIPEALLLQILGSQRLVLFTEGIRGSKDAEIYPILFPEFSILPGGGCQEVIRLIKSSKNNDLLRDSKVRGIVDRDFRSNQEIAALRADGVAVLDVAEVEHLYCIPELVEAVGNHMLKDQSEVLAALNLIRTAFSAELKGQAYKRSAAQLRANLSLFSETKGQSANDLQKAFSSFTSSVNVSTLFSESELLYVDAEKSGDIREMLRYLNRKNLYKQVASALGLDGEDYCRIARDLLKKSETLRQSAKTYLLAATN